MAIQNIGIPRSIMQNTNTQKKITAGSNSRVFKHKRKLSVYYYYFYSIFLY